MSDLFVHSTGDRPVDYLDSRGGSPEKEATGTWEVVSTLATWTIEETMHDGIVSTDDVEGIPRPLVDLYVDIAVRHALVREVDPGVWVATVAGLEGAWGDGESPDDAVSELREAIVGWVAVKRRVGATDIPLMEGIDLNQRS